ncbi:MAG: hypothetical protein HC899_30410 [Leptolyngbyaceae cyanobacterium SM1_4_3]|nr:hypothetical protein [Leptolyngbyaceae cyanobacterium SM1_4_3]
MLLIPQIPRNFSLRSWGDQLYQVSKSRLDQIEIQNRKVARLLCQLIPAQCPFERTLLSLLTASNSIIFCNRTL